LSTHVSCVENLQPSEDYNFLPRLFFSNERRHW